MSFRDRLCWTLREVGEALPVLAKDSDRVYLPTIDSFSELASDWELELTGGKGSKRAASHPGVIMEKGMYPSKVRTKKSNYEMEDAPWGGVAKQDPDSNSFLTSYRKAPSLTVSNKTFTKWESSNYETLALLNYSAQFTKAITIRLNSIMKDLKSSEPLDIPKVWNDVADVSEIAESIQKCMVDGAQMTLNRVGSQILLRKDAWIGVFSSHLPAAEKLRLRGGPSLNTHRLFSEEALSRAEETLHRIKGDKVHDELLNQHNKDANFKRRNSFRGDGKEEKKNQQSSGAKEASSSSSGQTYSGGAGRGKGSNNSINRRNNFPKGKGKKSA